MQLRGTSRFPRTDVHSQIQGNAARAADRAQLSKDEILELFQRRPVRQARIWRQAAAYSLRRPLERTDDRPACDARRDPAGAHCRQSGNGPGACDEAAQLVLSRMLEQGTITQEQYETAVNEPNTASVHERDLDVAAPYAAEWVRQLLCHPLRRDVYSSGYEAFTTIDAHLRTSHRRRSRRSISLRRRHGYRGPILHIELPGAAQMPTRLPPHKLRSPHIHRTWVSKPPSLPRSARSVHRCSQQR